MVSAVDAALRPSPLAVHDVRPEQRQVLDALAAISAKLDVLTAAHERLADDVAELATGRLSRDELDLLGRLLPALATATRQTAFAAVDVLDLPIARPIVTGYSASSLSRLFARASGRRIGRYRLEAAGRDRGGRLWTATKT